jgi:c-di-GMP-related signal transduction protein
MTEMEVIIHIPMKEAAYLLGALEGVRNRIIREELDKIIPEGLALHDEIVKALETAIETATMGGA